MRLFRFSFWYSGVLLGALLGLRPTWEPLTPTARWHQWERWDEARRRWGLK